MYEGTITITKRMKATKSSVYKNMLTRSDFNSRIAKLDEAQPSQIPSICAEICEMFDALGIPCEIGQDISYYKRLAEKSDLHEFRDVENSILNVMYENFGNYPTPEEYMLRIVNRLSNPDDGWQELSLRLRLLRHFIKYLNCCVYVLPNGRKKSIFGWEKVIIDYAKKAGAPKGTSISDVVDYIDEGIFDEYDGIIEECRSVLNQAQTSDVVRMLREQVKDLRKKIKKIKSDENELLKFQTALKKKEAELKEENKKIDSARSKLKYAREKYGLIKIANDLSKGIFKAGGSTKRDLYLFAIAFDMTYTIIKEPNALEKEELIDFNSDIEKNLFEDYYTNNLMRFITASYGGDLSALELDPSGVGINYKNFAEMVYIYFISKDLEPIEKLRRATEMIERLKISKGRVKVEDESTRYYRTLFTEEILSMNESEFESFISSNYDCDVEFEYLDENEQARTGKKSVLQLRTDQNTAFDFYTAMIREIENGDCVTERADRKDCNYGLYFTDVGVNETEYEKVLMSTLQNANSEKVKKFVRLLYNINRFLAQKEKLNITDAEKMTRTALITAYYYWYNNFNIIDETTGAEKSFVDVMDDYTDSITGLNSMLEASGYQPINDRNIFDLAVIFSSYAYLSM